MLNYNSTVYEEYSPVSIRIAEYDLKKLKNYKYNIQF